MSAADSQAVTRRPQNPIRLGSSPAVDFVDTRLPRYHPVFVDPGANNGNFPNHLVVSAQAQIASQDAIMRPLDRRSRSATAPIHGSAAQEPPGSSFALPSSRVHAPSQRPLPPEVEAMRFWKPIWPKAMDRLKETKEAPSREEKGFSIRKAKAWKDVEEALAKAREEYEYFGPNGSRRRKFFGKIKKRGRDLGDIAAGPVKQIVKVVPSNDIASPVLGAVNLLMNAWQEAIKAGKEVTESLDDKTLTNLFAGIDFHSDMFQGDQNIFNASVDLLTTVFKAIEGAIGFYISWQVSRLGKSIFQGENYLHSLRDCLKQIKTDEEKLTREAVRSFQWQTRQDLKKVLSMGARQNVIVLLDSHVAERNSKPVPGEKKLQGPEVVSVNSRESRTPTPEPIASLRVENLLEALDSTDVDEDDMAAVLSRAGEFPKEDRARAEQVVGTLEFRNWVVARGGSKLLVHGEYGGPEYSEVSPLSALCAALVQAVRTRPEFVTLVFFCGRHLDQRRDDHTGASGLMRSLIAQLLRQCPWACPDALGPDMSLGEIEDGDLEVLISLFFDVACRLPASKTLVIFIDGVQLYERMKFREGLYQVVDRLVELADDDGAMQSTLKVFLSSPWQTRTRELHRIFSRDQAILSMESMQDTGQGLSRSGIENAIGREPDHFPDEDSEA